MSLGIPQQSTFLYKSNWTPEIDALMLSTIIRMKNDLEWKGTVIPSHFLLEAEAAIAQEIGCSFTWEELYDRLQFLEIRYRTFKEVVQEPGTFWDVHSNVIIVVDKVWTDIFKKNKFAGAYYHRGEPEFQKLAILFSPEHIKVERKEQVIILSDTTIPDEVQESRKSSKAAASDEVSSPIGECSTKLRRRLFEDEQRPLDLESTNNKGNYYYVVGPDGEMKYQLHDVYPPSSPERVPKPRQSSHTSSVGSSSPRKWWRNPFK